MELQSKGSGTPDFAVIFPFYEKIFSKDQIKKNLLFTTQKPQSSQNVTMCRALVEVKILHEYCRTELKYLRQLPVVFRDFKQK